MAGGERAGRHRRGHPASPRRSRFGPQACFARPMRHNRTLHRGAHGSPYHGSLPAGALMTAAILAFLFGLLIGSFLNVCIYRWPRDLSVVRPRSHCPSCEKTIAWYDNVPLLSYALLGGRCRRCRARIAIRYPVVELLTGLCFSYFSWPLGPTLLVLKMCVFAALLTALLLCHLEERILPDELPLGGALAGLAFALFVPTPDITAQAMCWIAEIGR